VHGLPERMRRRLEASWAGTYRREVFERIDEERFAVLYSEKQSRPNAAVNVLVGLDILKSGHNWTDEEMYEHFLFDWQVRYALGCDNYGEGEFELRTIYNFRRRIAEHFLRTGENLVNQVFEQITDAQMAALGLKTDQQRLDSTMVLSNIADHSRLELLIQVIQRLWRVMGAADQERYGSLCQPYVKESAGQYTYRLKGCAVVWEHIRLVGEVLQHLLLEMRAGYAQEPIYGVAERFFAENFVVESQSLRAKANTEIGPGCLQSVDDVEATYRKKGSRAYKGYVANLAETCNPENPVQLIDQVQVAANQVSDIELLKAGIMRLKERTGVEMVVTDGGYVSPTVDGVLGAQQVRQITTGLTGSLPDHDGGRVAFSDFAISLDSQGEVVQVTCPAGQPAQVEPAASGKSYRLTFAAQICQDCPFFVQGQCPVVAKCDNFGFTLPKDRAQSAHRRWRFEHHKQEARNLRTAVEASVFQLKHKWAKGKVRVRGLFRVTLTVLGAAFSLNLRRIDAYYKGRLRGKLTAQPARAPALAHAGLIPA
jgi:hypothetical protein